jgi:hypothetical protein
VHGKDISYGYDGDDEREVNGQEPQQRAEEGTGGGEEGKKKRNREGVQGQHRLENNNMELGELSLQGGADTGDVGSEPQVRAGLAASPWARGR